MRRFLAPLTAALTLATITPAFAAEGPPAHGGYGLAIAGDFLANLEVGRYPRQVDYRFRAEATGTLASVRVYFASGTGYSAGNGGDVRVTLEGNNAGSPSGTVLGTGTVTDPLASTFRTIPMSGGTISAGSIYHLRFVNVDPSSTVNWVSVDDMAVNTPGAQRQPLVPDTDLASLYRDSTSGSWNTAPQHTPIFTLNYTNGTHHGPGVPYINARSQSALYGISGANRVGEQFTPTVSRSVSAASVRLRKTGAPGALTYTLRTTAGTVLRTATIPASSVPTSAAWVKGTFASPVTLAAGTSYRLEVSAPAGNPYQAWPLTQGDSGFTQPWMFTDGVLQRSTSSTWTTPSAADDLQFYLSTP